MEGEGTGFLPPTKGASGALWEEGLQQEEVRENAGTEEGSGPVGEKGTDEQAEAGWGHRLRGIPGKAQHGLVGSAALQRRSRGRLGEGKEGKWGREEAYYH